MKIQYWIYLVLYLGFYTKGFDKNFSLYILSCLLFNFQGPIRSRFSRQLGYYITSHSDCQPLLSKFLIFLVFRAKCAVYRAAQDGSADAWRGCQKCLAAKSNRLAAPLNAPYTHTSQIHIAADTYCKHTVADRHAPLWINAHYNRQTPAIHINKKTPPRVGKSTTRG